MPPPLPPRWMPLLALLPLTTLLCACAGPAASRNESTVGDLSDLQGKWEQVPEAANPATPNQRVIKEVKGGTETVTTYDRDGRVANAHTAKIRLGHSGRVPLYTFYERKVTAGPEQGHNITAGRSFVYRLRNNELVEVWGLLPGQEDREVTIIRWRRAG